MSVLNRVLKRRGVVIAAAAIAGAVLIGALTLGREKAPEVRTAEAVRGDIEVSISAAGKVQPKNYVDVGAQVSGQLERFLVEVGDRVEKGDLLAEIDETLAAAKVEADRAQLKELEASRAQQEASLELTRADAARAKMLYDADAISQAEFQASAADLKIAVARLSQLEAQIERQNSTLQGDLATLQFTKIYAPMSGTIVSQSAVEGQTLNANQTTPTILRIADLSVMTVEAEVSEADVLRVNSGQEAYFTTLGAANKKWNTQVRQVLPQPEVLNDVVLYKVLLDVENKDDQLKPEMTAQVFFVTGRARDAVLVPVAALMDMPQRDRPRGQGRGDGERRRNPGSSVMAAQAATPNDNASKFQDRRDDMRAAREANPDAEMKLVRVMADGEPQPRPVLVGLKTRAQAEILYGLEAGDAVVTGNTVAALPAAGDSRRGDMSRQFRRMRGR